MKDMAAEKRDYELSGSEAVPSVIIYEVNCPNSIIFAFLSLPNSPGFLLFLFKDN